MGQHTKRKFIKKQTMILLDAVASYEAPHRINTRYLRVEYYPKVRTRLLTVSQRHSGGMALLLMEPTSHRRATPLRIFRHTL